MSDVKHPIPVSPFFKEARDFVLKINSRMPLVSAILDDWNTGKDEDGRDVEGARIVYGASCVEDCQSTNKSHCQSCRLYKAAGGEDKLQNKFAWRATLCEANAVQLQLFPSQQFFLNCKTIDQYTEAYIRWFMERCDSQELLEAEVEWVAGFRILWLANVHDISGLLKKESELKRYIVEEVLKRMVQRGERERIVVVGSHAKKLGII